ncbi:NAD(P)H-hydrate dehydratase [Primorskyibacter sp. S87]|uniref:NAD(P)H-hydrate dehydratase n=1 Tax=Primorskyibacter sp. S87 TaxID=3415126 RepID=UPI003C7CC67B
MSELLTAAQMQAIEKAEMASGSVSGLELMERAGQGVVDAIFEEWPDLSASPQEEPDVRPTPQAVILCGPGNNGGDGFVVGRLLHGMGWSIEMFLYADPSRLPPDAKTNHDRWLELGSVRWLSFPELSEVDAVQIDRSLSAERGPTILVDALFGTGLIRPLAGLRKWLKLKSLETKDRRGSKLRRVAIDIPSGLCSDSGRVLEDGREADLGRAALPADLTVPFHRAKLGLVLADGSELSGSVRIKQIGLDQPESSQYVKVAEPAISRLGKTASKHKYGHGHALILSGGAGKTGAARLAARGALRIGAGLVTLGVPPSACLEVSAHITAVMMQRIEDGAALVELLQDPRFSALCLGPGLGLDRARKLVSSGLTAAGAQNRAVVLDADALTSFARAPDELFDMLHGGCVLTPHAGEFARLFPDLANQLKASAGSGPAFSRVDAARQAASRAGCVVLLKGPDTVIAAPNGCCRVNAAVGADAVPWLATAGSGDVLAGFITGLLARGMDPLTAAETGAWMHMQAARSFGPALIAEDLPEQMPDLFRKMGL